MNYMSIITNDIANGSGICVSLFVSGCPHKCKGCFNPEAWDYEAGQPFTEETMEEICDAIEANGILRNFSILGGEPLAPHNRTCVAEIIDTIRERYGNSIKIYIWTGYIIEDLIKENDIELNYILSNINVLIDGPYVEELRDITLYLRGSSNQRIIDLKEEFDIFLKK